MFKNFDIDIEMTATISPTIATNIIVAAVERQTGRQVQDIRVKLDGDKFVGFSIKFDSKMKTQNLVPRNEFILNNFDDN
jgi:hypothetical protein